jgi:hypothetical protein
MDLSLMTPLELLLATTHVAQTLRVSIGEPFDLSGFDSDSRPLDFMQFILLSSPCLLEFICRMVSAIVYCALFTLCSFNYWIFVTSFHQFCCGII